MNKTITLLTIMFIIILGLGIKQCAEGKAKHQKAIEQCEIHNGVPIFSVWDSNVMTDCIFPPELEIDE